MQEHASILEFQNVTFRTGSVQTTAVGGVDFKLGCGEAVVVRVEEGREHVPLAPLAQGLMTPDSGKVYFKGECWEQTGPGRQSVMRGRIRRIFEHYGWVTNLDVMENMSLAESHHTQRPLEEIHQEIRGLARRFGIEEVPAARPTRVHPMILRKLEWVRAFVGSPDLVILERPFSAAPKADAIRLLEAVCEALKRGVAVLWISDESLVFECRDMFHVRCFRMDGEKMIAEEHNKGINS